MQTLHQLTQLRGQVAQWRQAGERIALVPTMGNLHAGHLHLVAQARTQADRVVVTIFVNPMQFGEGEDFDAYPRTLEADCAALKPAGADLVFAPSVAEVYPDGLDLSTRVAVPDISADLCGAFRPGHFEGVATVVAKLFNMVLPDVALFGEKDFQQLMVIRRMARDLNFPIEIVGVPTVRESDGLAMSSRNGYLSHAERVLAPLIYQRLEWMAKRLHKGERNFKALAEETEEALQQGGFKPDYVEVRRAQDLHEPSVDDTQLVILVAAYLGQARLIDNLTVTL